MLTSFFRYHGAWAPGVRLFRALGFGAKAVIISLVFGLSLAVIGVQYFAKALEEIHATRTEREGVAVLRAFAPVLQGVIDTRNATRALLGGHDASARYQQAREHTDVALTRLEQVLEQRGDPLGVGASVRKLKASWAQTASAANGADAQGRTVFGPVTAASVELLEAVGDGSNLVLDPELASFYLVDVIVMNLPRTMEDAGQLWGWGTFASKRGGIGTEHEAKWLVWSARVQSGVDDAKAALKRAVRADPSLAQRIDARPLDVVLALREAGHKAVFDASGPDAASYFAQGDAALAGLSRLSLSLMGTLDELLAIREARLVSALWWSAGAMLASLALAYYFFTAFRKVLEGGLREVTTHIEAMRDGNLTTRPRAWGRDEVAGLMTTLADMQQSLCQIVTQVRHSSESIVSASTQISSGSRDLSARTESSAANLQESAAAMEQVSGTVRQTASNAETALQLARTSATVAARGGQVIGSMVERMTHIRDASQRVADITSTIDGIAFQTNILALNAAVEAARAGESGRGFAVVASEVRELASRAGSAAKEIRTLIQTSNEQIADGVTLASDAGRTVGDLVASTREVDDLLHEIATGAAEQSRALAQTTQAVQTLDTATQQNAALVEETTAAAASLHEQATQLAVEVARFRLPEAV